MLVTTKKFQRINQNDLARHIACREGLRRSVSIGQIKEVMRHTLDILACEWSNNPKGVVELFERHGA